MSQLVDQVGHVVWVKVGDDLVKLTEQEARDLAMDLNRHFAQLERRMKLLREDSDIIGEV